MNSRESVWVMSQEPPHSGGPLPFMLTRRDGRVLHGCSLALADAQRDNPGMQVVLTMGL